MFASIRRYRLHSGTTEALARRVDEGFAEEVAAEPAFVSYEFVDCGDGEVMTISILATAEAAETSRDHARRWSDENLGEFKFTRSHALRGEILVSRASGEMLAPGHAGGSRKFASIRRYRLRHGEVGELMHTINERFADRIQALPGFEAYHALDCGHAEIASISLLRDQASAEESDELALAFVRDSLAGFDLEGTEVVGGQVRVSRATAALLEPAHA